MNHGHLFIIVLCSAVLMDSILGDPRSFPHPVVMIGRVISFWHKRLFTGSRSFMRGLILCAVTLLATGIAVWAILRVSGCHVLVRIYLLYSALAWRDLKDETAPVVSCLLRNDLPNARAYLARVVGRDTQNLDEAEITRAVVETIAENSIDGVMSVLFFAGLGQVMNADYGACMCVWLFKATSTLDSMVGYESFGRYGTASARLDDALNFIPARLGGMVIVIAGRRGLLVFMRDRLKHDSPNSAHGESAFAGALDVRLGGGAFYEGVFEPREWLNPEGNDAMPEDVISAWRLLDASCSLFTILVILLVWTL